MLRRYKLYNKEIDNDILEIRGLVINKKEHNCYLYDKNIDLTPIEFEILLYLMTNKGKVVSSEELFEKVWKEKYFDSNNTVMVHIRRIREKLGEDTKDLSLLKLFGEWDIKLKIKSITKLKIKLCLELLGNILLFLFIFFVVYFLITLLFENSLSVAVSNFNYDLYAFIVNNRDNILYVYLGIVLIISIYRFISKYVNSINEVYESLDLILKEDDEAIKLPSEVNDFSKKLNDIKYNYILSKKKEEDAIIKKNDLIMYRLMI